jgi:hypothetical protein
MLDEKPEYAKDIDPLKVSLGFCIAITLFLFFVPKDGGSTSRLADSASTYVGLVTFALIVGILGRTFLRWRRRRKGT